MAPTSPLALHRQAEDNRDLPRFGEPVRSPNSTPDSTPDDASIGPLKTIRATGVDRDHASSGGTEL
ncbi:hypothetical protein [Streptomyces cyaneofuscatus]|uniref:hypothetical protein n=1 Tax=Streptomyces cyaneofuscatus TaxID=66883 RepID=UPI0036DE30A8